MIFKKKISMETIYPCKLTILKESIVECFIQPTGDVFTSTADKQLTNYPPAAPLYTFSCGLTIIGQTNNFLVVMVSMYF